MPKICNKHVFCIVKNVLSKWCSKEPPLVLWTYVSICETVGCLKKKKKTTAHPNKNLHVVQKLSIQISISFFISLTLMVLRWIYYFFIIEIFKYFFPFFLLGKHIDTSRLEEGLIIHLQFCDYVMGVGRLMTLFSKFSL